MERGDRVPARDARDLIEDALGCAAYPGVIAWIRSARPIAPSRDQAAYPIRIAWALRDRTIPFRRYGRPFVDAVGGADQVTLPGVGHIPMYDDPAIVIRTILEITRPLDDHRRQR
jgi:pimeloyl-ACP methyl ester carboxylesterase